MAHPSILAGLLVGGLFVGVSVPSTALDALDGLPEELGPMLDCTHANLPKRSSVQTVEFRSVDPSQHERRIKARVHWKRFDGGLSKLMLQVSEPPDLKDTAFLFIEGKKRNDMFIYLPAMDKVRRANSSTLSGSLFGSDFTYEDFMRLQGLGRGGRHELLDAAVGNESLRVVAHYPDPESGSSYQRVVSYWDRESCVLVRSEMWEQGESPRKVLTVDPNTVFSSKGAKIPRNLLMTDMRDKSSTHLSIDEIEIDVKMSKKLFSAAALGRN